MPNLDTRGIRQVVGGIASNRRNQLLTAIGALTPMFGLGRGRFSTNETLTLARARTASPNAPQEWKKALPNIPLAQLALRLFACIVGAPAPT